MYDDRPLVDLINARFDDVISKVDSLKVDMLREYVSLKVDMKEHEAHDTERFSAISQKLSRLDKIEWMILGGSAVVAFVFNFTLSLFR